MALRAEPPLTGPLTVTTQLGHSVIRPAPRAAAQAPPSIFLGEVRDGCSHRCPVPGGPQSTARPRSPAVWRLSGLWVLMGDRPYPGPALLPAPSWHAPRDPEAACAL